jgi:hypothetical protein
MLDELSRRVEILEWMQENNIRAFKDVARIVSSYIDTPDDVMEKVRKTGKTKRKEENKQAGALEKKLDGAEVETPSNITINSK